MLVCLMADHKSNSLDQDTWHVGGVGWPDAIDLMLFMVRLLLYIATNPRFSLNMGVAQHWID